MPAVSLLSFVSVYLFFAISSYSFLYNLLSAVAGVIPLWLADPKKILVQKTVQPLRLSGPNRSQNLAWTILDFPSTD